MHITLCFVGRLYKRQKGTSYHSIEGLKNGYPGEHGTDIFDQASRFVDLDARIAKYKL